eukprot:jgi/Galph1/1288/GphlegSOOS_G6039.1
MATEDDIWNNLYTKSSTLVRQPAPELPKELPKDALKGINLCEKHLANVFRCFMLFAEERRCMIQMTIYKKCKERRDEAIRKFIWEWDEGYFASLSPNSRKDLLAKFEQELHSRNNLLDEAKYRSNKLGAIHMESRIADLRKRMEHLKQFS